MKRILLILLSLLTICALLLPGCQQIEDVIPEDMVPEIVKPQEGPEDTKEELSQAIEEKNEHDRFCLEAAVYADF